MGIVEENFPGLGSRGLGHKDWTIYISFGLPWESRKSRSLFIFIFPRYPLCSTLYPMTRAELLRALIRQAKSNGFEFRRWYTLRLGSPWTSFAEAVQTLSEQRRYYALLFAHEFAEAFWRTGSKMTFVVPTSTFTRVSRDGTPRIVKRKGHIRRSVIPDAWRYHLKEMAVADEPLRYIRKFLLIEEDLAGVSYLSDEDELEAVALPEGSTLSDEP